MIAWLNKYYFTSHSLFLRYLYIFWGLFSVLFCLETHVEMEMCEDQVSPIKQLVFQAWITKTFFNSKFSILTGTPGTGQYSTSYYASLSLLITAKIAA